LLDNFLFLKDFHCEEVLLASRLLRGGSDQENATESPTAEFVYDFKVLQVDFAELAFLFRILDLDSPPACGDLPVTIHQASNLNKFVLFLTLEDPSQLREDPALLLGLRHLELREERLHGEVGSHVDGLEPCIVRELGAHLQFFNQVLAKFGFASGSRVVESGAA